MADQQMNTGINTGINTGMNTGSSAGMEGGLPSSRPGTTGASGSATQNLGEKTRRAVSDVQHKAGEQVRSGIDSGKQRAAGALHGVAESLMNGSATQQDGASQYIRQAGEQVRRAADYLEQTDVRELTRNVETFARRQPAAFLGGAFIMGVIAARFLKSSQRSQDEERGFNSPYRSGEPSRGLADRGAERGGWYENEQPVNSFREPLPPTFGGQP